MISTRTAKAFCKDDISLIENYDKAIADDTQTWHCHHRRETIFSRKDLIEIGEYYNRPACELIFLTPFEHIRLHQLGKHNSEETRKKMSESNKGEKCYIFGKHHSEETRKKISESNKGENNPMFGKHHSAETRKKLSEARKGKHHSEESRKKISEALNGKPAWNKGKQHSAEARKKMSEAQNGKHWYNNGVKCIKAKICPEGFVPGRIK